MWENWQEVEFYEVGRCFVGPQGVGIGQENFPHHVRRGGDGVRKNHARRGRRLHTSDLPHSIITPNPSRTSLPKRNLSRNLEIDPLFLLTTRRHPLNTLTHGSLPMYWLGTSKWCLGPLCRLHSIWIWFFLAFTPFLLPPCLFDSVVLSSWCLSLVVWRMCELLSSCSPPFIPSLD